MHVYFIDFVLLDRSLLPSFDLQMILVIMKKGELHMSGIWVWAGQRRAKAKGLKNSSPMFSLWFLSKASSKGYGKDKDRLDRQKLQSLLFKCVVKIKGKGNTNWNPQHVWINHDWQSSWAACCRLFWYGSLFWSFLSSSDPATHAIMDYTMCL